MIWFFLAAFAIGILFGAIIVRTLPWRMPSLRSRRPRNGLEQFPRRADGTHSVSTVTGYTLTDTWSPDAWPLDRDKVRYRR